MWKFHIRLLNNFSGSLSTKAHWNIYHINYFLKKLFPSFPSLQLFSLNLFVEKNETLGHFGSKKFGKWLRDLGKKSRYYLVYDIFPMMNFFEVELEFLIFFRFTAFGAKTQYNFMLKKFPINQMIALIDQ